MLGALPEAELARLLPDLQPVILPRPTELDAPDSEWARMLEVNVMSQVRAARRLVPLWLESGGDRLVLTLSRSAGRHP